MRDMRVGEKPTSKEFLKEREKTLWMVARFPFPNNATVLNTYRVLPECFDNFYKKEEHINLINFKEMGIFDDVINNTKRCLEIGCGGGKAIQQIYDLNRAGNGIKTIYSALEPEPEAFEFATDYLKGKDILIVNKTIEKAKFKAGSFDFIYSHHVFEHLKTPMIMIEKSYKWLVKGGKMMVSSPNADAFHPKFFDINKWRNTFSTHVWLPGKKTFCKLMEETGFKVVKFFTYGGFVAPRNIFKEFGNWLLKKTNMGDNMVVLLEKK